MEKNNKLNLNLTGNKLKLIAVICMIIDHIGYFFANKISYEMYVICRCVGRISMPLFTFLLVEGFFYTRNLKKYILRIFSVAIITQIIITFFNYINTNYFSSKINNLEIFNILFSFTIILLILRLIDRRVLKVKLINNSENNFKNNKLLDCIIRILGIICIISIYFTIKIDYGICLIVIAIIMYYLKKYEKRIGKYLKYFLEIISITIFSVLAINNTIGIFAIFSFLFILMYNGKKGERSKLLSNIYYHIFPLQYIIIYMLALII